MLLASFRHMQVEVYLMLTNYLKKPHRKLMAFHMQNERQETHTTKSTNAIAQETIRLPQLRPHLKVEYE